MTWPINAQEELKEVQLTGDKEALEGARKRDYSTLINHQIVYKATILKAGVIKTLFRMLMPRLEKGIRSVCPTHIASRRSLTKAESCSHTGTGRRGTRTSSA